MSAVPLVVRNIPVRVEVILLAAGASSRMGGVDKLLQVIDGVPLIRRCAAAALGSRSTCVHVVLPPDHSARRRALNSLAVHVVDSPDWRGGLSASIRAGLAALSPNCDAAILALADMPDVTPTHFDLLIAAFDPSAGHEICRAMTGDGRPGHPVLFGRRFFEPLAVLTGDAGARELLRGAGDFLVDVPTDGTGAVIDLDTPQDWQNWRNRAT